MYRGVKWRRIEQRIRNRSKVQKIVKGVAYVMRRRENGDEMID